ncbi:hypothetical protein [Brachybacterium vulturis]|uniref:hypothetical protein n=1 Tax=Brachybacterium vulturis TaxID=2017484 RepID=UPI0037369CE3
MGARLPVIGSTDVDQLVTMPRHYSPGDALPGTSEQRRRQVAAGTLDHTIQKVQRSNIDVLDQLVGGNGHQVSVKEEDMTSLAIGDVM